MTASERLILYTRADCHLCEVAAVMLDGSGANWLPVDIDSDPGLAEKYGLHVPVIRNKSSGAELYFPFDDEKLARFLAAE